MLLGVLLLLLSIIILLAIPLTLAFRISRDRSIRITFILIWLFGLIKVEFGSQIDGKTRRKKNVDLKRRRRGNSYIVGRILKQSEFRRHLLSTAKRLFRAIRPEEVKLEVRLGLNDPADTGVLWGSVGPIAALLGTCSNLSIDLTPDFGQEIFDFNGNGKLRFIPLQLIFLLGAFMMSPVVWKSLVKPRV